MNLLPNKKTAFVAAIASLVSSGSLLAQQTVDFQSTGSRAGGGIGGIVGLLLGILCVIGMWKIFTKAGQPGWACLIPIYNAYIICKIAGKPGWWVILLLVPIANIVVGILLTVALAKSFGKGVGFAIGMLLLSFIFYPILGFGDATYQRSAA